jgi:hypothetical protein
MKTCFYRKLFGGLIGFILFAGLLSAQAGSHFVDLGTRWHSESEAREDLPFGDGDMSYVVGYEYHENNAYWQLGLGIAPDLTALDVEIAGTTNAVTGRPETYKDSTVDMILTPQINLIFEDGPIFGGLGGYWSYVMRDGKLPDGRSAQSDWSDFYGQFILGFTVPLGRMKLEMATYYPFADFDPFADFEFSELEYGALLKFAF